MSAERLFPPLEIKEKDPKIGALLAKIAAVAQAMRCPSSLKLQLIFTVYLQSHCYANIAGAMQ
jgi:hypothetical protein